MGVMFIYQTSQPNSSIWTTIAINFGIPYFSISISLNILLTLMIVTRLVLHNRVIRTVTGTPSGLTGLYKAIITMLVESSALYAVSSLLFVGPRCAGNHAADIFLPILAETQVCAFLRWQSLNGCLTWGRIWQVIAPLLIIQRVANQSALTSNTISAGHTNSFKARRGVSTGGSGTLPGGYPMGSADKYENRSGDLGVGVETTIEFNRDEV